MMIGFLSVVSNIQLRTNTVYVFGLVLVLLSLGFLYLVNKQGQLNHRVKNLVNFNHEGYVKVRKGIMVFTKQPGQAAFVLFLDIFFIALVAFILRAGNLVISAFAGNKVDPFSVSGANAALIAKLLAVVCVMFIVIFIAYVLIRSVTWSIIREQKMNLIFIKWFSIFQVFWYVLILVLIVVSSGLFKERVATILLLLELLAVMYVNLIVACSYDTRKNFFSNIKKALAIGFGRIKSFLVPALWLVLIFVLLATVINYFDKFMLKVFSVTNNSGGMLVIKLVLVLVFYQLIRRVCFNISRN